MANLTGTNAYQKSAKSSGYAKVPTAGSPNYTEAWALIEAARRMATAIEIYAKSEDPNHPKSREILRQPLRLNWRLWTIFQAELISSLDDADSLIPDDVRTNMLTLCQFVDKHTTQTLADPTPEKLVVLIDINRNIASGHLETPDNATQSAPTESADNAISGDTSSSASSNTQEAEPISGFSEEA